MFCGCLTEVWTTPFDQWELRKARFQRALKIGHRALKQHQTTPSLVFKFPRFQGKKGIFILVHNTYETQAQ